MTGRYVRTAAPVAMVRAEAAGGPPVAALVADLLDQCNALLKGLEWLGVEPLLLRVATELQQVCRILLPQLTNDPVSDQNRKLREVERH